MFVLFAIALVFSGIFMNIYARQRSWTRVLILLCMVLFLTSFVQVTMHYRLTHIYYGGFR